MSKIIISPSMMCANFKQLEEEIKALENANIDIFHMDIMDGHYVKNHALSLHDVKTLKEIATKKIDVHLMVTNPEEIVDLYIDAGVDIVYFHYDTVNHINRFVTYLKDRNVEVGIVLNPLESFNIIKQIAHRFDYIMCMTVDPGYAGQQYISEVNEKIIEIAKYKKEQNLDFTISVDGAISEEKINTLSQYGVEKFIVGTSTLFNKEEDYSSIIKRVKGN